MANDKPSQSCQIVDLTEPCTDDEKAIKNESNDINATKSQHIAQDDKAKPVGFKPIVDTSSSKECKTSDSSHKASTINKVPTPPNKIMNSTTKIEQKSKFLDKVENLFKLGDTESKAAALFLFSDQLQKHGDSITSGVQAARKIQELYRELLRFQDRQTMSKTKSDQIWKSIAKNDDQEKIVQDQITSIRRTSAQQQYRLTRHRQVGLDESCIQYVEKLHALRARQENLLGDSAQKIKYLARMGQESDEGVIRARGFEEAISAQRKVFWQAARACEIFLCELKGVLRELGTSSPTVLGKRKLSKMQEEDHKD